MQLLHPEPIAEDTQMPPIALTTFTNYHPLNMKKNLFLALLFLLAGCTAQKGFLGKSGNTRTKPVYFVDHLTYLLVDSSTDTSYGFEERNPIKTGGANDKLGPTNQRRFLNALLGPEGEEVGYYRLGSCCRFKTPNGFGGSGMLDIYKVFWAGSPDTLSLYINMYDEGDLKIPLGFTAKKIKL